MFKFNFNVGESNEESQSEDDNKSANLQWQKPSIFNPSLHGLEEILKEGIMMASFNEINLRYVSPSTAESYLQQAGSDDIKSALNGHSDLIPSVYEGGLKIWECTWDLLHYLANSDINFENLRVLELGCGAGLPAIYAGLKGSNISLQDYNEEVLKYLTVPNVLLNLMPDKELQHICKEEAILTKLNSQVKFYMGDWDGLDSVVLDDKLSNEIIKYDLILTSETIYNTENHLKLLETVTRCLHENGSVLIAAKSCYFGVGGTTAHFVQLVKDKDMFSVESVVTNDKGLKREIIILKFKSKR